MRRLDPRLADIIDERVQVSANACNHVADRNPRGLLLEVGRSLVSSRDDPSREDHQALIALIQATAGGEPGDNWCMSFVQSCIAYVEQKLGISSGLHASASVMAVWEKATAAQKVQAIPLGGAIAIWQSQEDRRVGHSGIILDCDGTRMNIIEGNAAANESDEKHGDGIYSFSRSWDRLWTDERGLKLLGALKPF